MAALAPGGQQVAPIATDALIIGAGPVGLFQVFQLGLLNIKAHVVDALPQPGGQCMALYPDKPIYDIPGLLATTGQDLTATLLKQSAPMGAVFHLGQEVSAIEQRSDKRFDVQTSKGTLFVSKTIFIAAGAGAFQPRRLHLEGLAKFEGTQVFYSAGESSDFAGKNLVIFGGDETAIEWAVNLAQDGAVRAASVTLVHRRDNFQAPPATVARMRALHANGAIKLLIGQPTAWHAQHDQLTQLDVTNTDGESLQVPLDAMLVSLGLSPKLGPLANWGLDMERKQLRVDTEKFSTSVAGIFAVGDINTYPGKKKLILCGFHECALAAYGAAELIFPDQSIQLQYTTTSTKLHKLLGVSVPPDEVLD
jgi:thioredoxin reductase (NADPH)